MNEPFLLRKRLNYFDDPNGNGGKGGGVFGFGEANGGNGGNFNRGNGPRRACGNGGSAVSSTAFCCNANGDKGELVVMAD
jgi:hypothetical protein